MPAGVGVLDIDTHAHQGGYPSPIRLLGRSCQGPRSKRWPQALPRPVCWICVEQECHVLTDTNRKGSARTGRTVCTRCSNGEAYDSKTFSMSDPSAVLNELAPVRMTLRPASRRYSMTSAVSWCCPGVGLIFTSTYRRTTCRLPTLVRHGDAFCRSLSYHRADNLCCRAAIFALPFWATPS